MVNNKCDGSCQVFHCGLCSRAIDECKGIIALFTEFLCVRETVVHCSYIGKTSAGVTDGERSTGIASEKEQPCVAFLRVGGLLLIGIDIVEDVLAGICLSLHVVHNLHRFVGIDVAIPRQL